MGDKKQRNCSTNPSVHDLAKKLTVLKRLFGSRMSLGVIFLKDL